MVASHVGRDIGLRVRGSVLRELTALREGNERLRSLLCEVDQAGFVPPSDPLARRIEAALSGRTGGSMGEPRGESAEVRHG